ncbi:hypothetical protein K488DRAFT_15597, partial [Vararia minispora EC-137]
RRIVFEEIDLEIGIRQRLQETVHSRIAWALLLQESLKSGISSEAFLRDESFDFQSAALDALRAAEVPILPLLDHEARLAPPPSPVSQILPPSPPQSSASLSSSSVPVPTRTPSRTTRTRGQPALPRAAPKKLLYLCNTVQHPPTLAKLVCPDCARADLPNVQGLLNHCRLRHRREFGSHDECIRACAVLVPPEDEAFVREHGTELPPTRLPSLRTLFEHAVGSAGAPGVDTHFAEDGTSVAPQDTSTHLSRTLGHHADTPALAPFLGRTARRRAITVHGEDEPVDIIGAVEASPQRAWRKHFMHRSVARPTLDAVDIDAHAPAHARSETPTSLPESGARTPIDGGGTRFHITARITVSDRSLWLPPERREPELQDHTHRWMIVVEAPSYSFHASTFITKMTVRSLTQPPPSSLKEPLVVPAYPFVAVATTDRPFLAEVALSFAGTHNADRTVQHWVELDAIKSATPALGDEQVLDIELDRATELLPIAPSVPLSSIWAAASAVNTGAVAQKLDKSRAEPAEPYARLLKTLLPGFPLTAGSRADAKARAASLPYKVVSGPQAFRALVPGRRKAIEMGRARALHAAYTQARSEFSPQEQQAHLPLSVADVFCWFEDEGLFLRPQAAHPLAHRKRTAASRAPQAFCPVCGIVLSAHP